MGRLSWSIRLFLSKVKILVLEQLQVLVKSNSKMARFQPLPPSNSRSLKHNIRHLVSMYSINRLMVCHQVHSHHHIMKLSKMILSQKNHLLLTWNLWKTLPKFEWTHFLSWKEPYISYYEIKLNVPLLCNVIVYCVIWISFINFNNC